MPRTWKLLALAALGGALATTYATLLFRRKSLGTSGAIGGEFGHESGTTPEKGVADHGIATSKYHSTKGFAAR